MKREEDNGMKEEENILKKIGRENTFKVPDGYFDHLASEVMDKLPEQEKNVSLPHKPTAWTKKLKPLLYMAAMFAGAAFIIRVASLGYKETNVDIAATETNDTEIVSDQMIDVAIEGTMLDDYSLYVYLSDVSAD